ncbi:MAG TPA: ABC transporter permease [Candidatus Limnocylindria bacterium]
MDPEDSGRHARLVAAQVQRRPAPSRERWLKPVLRLGILALLIGGWQLIGNDEIQLAMPTFTRTMAALFDMLSAGFAEDSLLEGLVITNQALVGGFLLALAVSLPLGIAMGSSRGVANIATPYLTVLLAAPMIALVPIVQVVLGLTLAARIAVVFLFSFIYMTINTMVGVQEVAPDLKEMGRSFGATRWQMLRMVTFPAAVPAIMAGIRLGLGRAIIGMIIAELSLIGAGIGSLILEYQVRFQPAYVFGIVLLAVLEGVLLMELARRVEGRFARWKGVEGVE